MTGYAPVSSPPPPPQSVERVCFSDVQRRRRFFFKRHLGSILEVGGRGWVAHLCARDPPPPPPVLPGGSGPVLEFPPEPMHVEGILAHYLPDPVELPRIDPDISRRNVPRQFPEPVTKPIRKAQTTPIPDRLKADM